MHWSGSRIHPEAILRLQFEITIAVIRVPRPIGLFEGLRVTKH